MSAEGLGAAPFYAIARNGKYNTARFLSKGSDGYRAGKSFPETRYRKLAFRLPQVGASRPTEWQSSVCWPRSSNVSLG